MCKLELLVNVRYVFVLQTAKKNKVWLYYKQRNHWSTAVWSTCMNAYISVHFNVLYMLKQAFNSPSANWGKLRQGLSRSKLLFYNMHEWKVFLNMQSCLHTQMWQNMIDQELSGRVYTFSWALYYMDPWGQRCGKRREIREQIWRIVVEKFKEC